MIVYLRYLNITGNVILSQTESIFGSSLSNRVSRILRISLFPVIILLMVIHQLRTTTWKWIDGISEILMGFVATYLTMVVMVECTVRVLLLKAGIGLESTVSTMSNNPNQRCFLEKRKAALHRCIERSLIKCNPETQQLQQKQHCNRADADAVVYRRNSTCCSICLEAFLPGESIVTGRKNCCKSNVFHAACIKQWLSINDSCPNCRQPMLEEEETEPTPTKVEDPPINNRDFWAQFKIRIDTATRLRNEVLSYFLETERSRGNPSSGM